MNVAVYDILIHQLKNEIKNRKDMLLDNYRLLNNNINDNELLLEIHNEYKSYYDYIIKIKNEKKIMLEKICNYLDELIIENNLTQNDINIKKNEQQQILNKLDKVKIELDNIVSNV